MFKISSDVIDRSLHISNILNIHAGALVTFEGWVRDHNEGKKVSSLEYQVYEELATLEGKKILKEAKEKFNLHHIECVHRYGHLSLGDTAIWIGATATHRDDAYKASRYVIDEIKFRLPIWKKEHYVEDESKWVFCKDHHTHVHFDEEDYYKKQDKLVDQNKLKDSKALVIGAGGLGCPVLQSLAAAGVGEIEIVDFDTISIGNIHRQFLYSPEVVGEKKSVIAANLLQNLNPFIKVISTDLYIDESNVVDLTRNRDIVLDCSDNLATKFLLHDACFKNKVPLISASIYKYEGQIRTFIPGGDYGCLRCNYESTPSDSQIGNCNDFGVLGSSVAVIGSLQASEAILLLNEDYNNTSSQTLLLDLKRLTQMKLNNIKKEHCQTCAGEVVLESDDLEVSLCEVDNLSVELIDIRDREDSDVENLLVKNKKTVLYCHRGIRSKQLVISLRDRGVQNIYSLKGGARSL
ncbi:ThiF family adenylyltransferase [Halobacteriovorax sp.]|uniref:ThiF family adenylyltransferase n=1 Tax=Halobacteriovorax sp. TaxID=2020862 RepID=UPI003565357A